MVPAQPFFPADSGKSFSGRCCLECAWHRAVRKNRHEHRRTPLLNPIVPSGKTKTKSSFASLGRLVGNLGDRKLHGRCPLHCMCPTFHCMCPGRCGQKRCVQSAVARCASLHVSRSTRWQRRGQKSHTRGHCHLCHAGTSGICEAWAGSACRRAASARAACRCRISVWIQLGWKWQRSSESLKYSRRSNSSSVRFTCGHSLWSCKIFKIVTASATATCLRRASLHPVIKSRPLDADTPSCRQKKQTRPTYGYGCNIGPWITTGALACNQLRMLRRRSAVAKPKVTHQRWRTKSGHSNNLPLPLLFDATWLLVTADIQKRRDVLPRNIIPRAFSTIHRNNPASDATAAAK